MMRAFSWVFLSVAVLFSTYPFFWMFLSSFKTNQEIYQPALLFPSQYNWQAYFDLFSSKYIPFLSIFFNSFGLAISQAIVATIVSAGVGFALSKCTFRGSGVLLSLVIFIVLIPKQTLAIPTFEWMSWLGWRGSLFSLLLSGAVTGLGVLFFFQVFRCLPNEWVDLARIEGLNRYQAYLRLLPLVSPGLVTFFVLHFVLSFHDHLLPLLLLSDENMTLPLALSKLKDSSHRIPESVGMAASTLATLPMLVIFTLAFSRLRTALREVSLS